MFRFFLVFLLSLSLFATASFASDDVPRISIDELKSKIDSGADIIIFDVRGAISGKKVPKLIKNAVRVPVMEIYSGKALPGDKTKEIILYCTWEGETTSASIALILINNGYENARPLEGGLVAWEKAGYPME